MKEFYQLLKEKFPTKSAVLTELINLHAIRHLPKGTEHFISDIHGEFTALQHVLRNGSGNVKQKVLECFAEHHITNIDIDDLCSFIYYPEEKIHFELQRKSPEEIEDWYRYILPLLLLIVRYVGRKYTRSKVRKAFPKEFAYIVDELVAEVQAPKDKQAYVQSIIDTIIQLQQMDQLLITLANVIQRLVVDHLHVVGDIYDRGPQPDIIMEWFTQLPSIDIQWGNHDITWLGAVAGSLLCMVNVLRVSARYNNLSLIEDAYGINLRPLIDYSKQHYRPLPTFQPILDEGTITKKEAAVLNIVQQATAILQFKLEHQLIARRFDFHLHHRDLLPQIDYKTLTIRIKDQHYPLNDFNATCIQPDDPGRLSEQETVLLEQLMNAFQNSEKLKRHMDFLLEKGSMYLCYNNNLLLHGCIPLHENGDVKSIRIDNESYSGKKLLDFYERHIRKSYRMPHQHEDLSTDLFWYLWIGECSSLFGKQAMTTFERYYITDKATHVEQKNAYYHLRNDERVCNDILTQFGLTTSGHIINGHTPVLEKDGENPIKANGRLIVIDGGYAKGYQKKTGIAGYTLLSNSYGLQLVAHQPFTSVERVLNGHHHIVSTKRLVETVSQRTLVNDTNIGSKINNEIKHLEHLYQYFEDY